MEPNRLVGEVLEGRLWLSVAQGAEYLGVSAKNLYNLIGRGIVPASRVGRLLRIYRPRLDSWLLSQEAGGPPRKAGQ